MWHARRPSSETAKAPLSTPSGIRSRVCGRHRPIPSRCSLIALARNSLRCRLRFQSGTGSDAEIGINTNTPAATLDNNGGGIIRGALSLPATGTATATAGYNSEPFNFAASAYYSGTGAAVNETFQPVTFRYKRPFDDGSKPLQYGLIAEVYPELVARSAAGQIETVKYQLLDPMLLNELRKQNTTIAAQKEQIRSLEERLAKVEAALSGSTVTASG